MTMDKWLWISFLRRQGQGHRIGRHVFLDGYDGDSDVELRSSESREAVVGSSDAVSERAAAGNPHYRLSGDFSDPIEVGVVVPNDRVRCLCGGSDE